jgi:GNAT superfamily N-acetyltransferase
MRFHLRMAVPEDAGTIARHRAKMFQEMGVLPETSVEALQNTCAERLPILFRDGVYVGWLAVGDAPGEVIAGVGLYIRAVLPRPALTDTGDTALIDREGIVLNAYTEPTHRRRGLARALMSELLRWTRDHDVRRVVLHASDAGRALYEELGFTPSNEMRFMGPR